MRLLLISIPGISAFLSASWVTKYCLVIQIAPLASRQGIPSQRSLEDGSKLVHFGVFGPLLQGECDDNRHYGTQLCNIPLLCSRIDHRGRSQLVGRRIGDQNTFLCFASGDQILGRRAEGSKFTS
jgi:hypothetical protein